MTTIQRLTGMQDILPGERPYWDWLAATARDVALRYGFQRLDIPVLEDMRLFERGVGTGSDFFVQKEMYTIDEGDGQFITLRPEFTAGMVRAYIENGLFNETQPVKLFTIGPAFRRERPQAGRFRQHTQFNCEILGEDDPAADVEVMMLGRQYLRELGYRGVNFQLNSTGCPQCRPAYIEALKQYLADPVDDLAEVDRERLRRNPLRVLDSKEPGMDELLAGAPHSADYLCDDCAAHFAQLRRLLDALQAPYTVNYRLVRGIDYYVKTVFEVWAEGIGAQAAVFSGGRYDGLAEAIGGPPTPGVGFGSGFERVILGLQEQGVEPPPLPQTAVMIVHFGGETKVEAVRLAQDLRESGISAWMAFARDRRSMKSQMREADKRDVLFTLILGENELQNREVAVRPMAGGDQTMVARDDLLEWLQEHSA